MPKVPYFGVLLVVLLQFASCTETEQPSIDETTYESLLYESELIFALHTQTMDSVLTQKLLDSMWIIYNVTPDQFAHSHRLYERDVEMQLERVKRVAERLSNEHNELEKRLYDLREEERLERRREAGID